ncbi:TspO/MBR family protein [Terrarubrum flagellatum]|uniref:TspO/MBR family protein n=1 Tax=Terrirubrum flagellatum TaxID=2895980 RepID=UPI0031454DF6
MGGARHRGNEKARSPWLPAFLAVAPAAAASLIGSLATASSLAPWYASLIKPPFTPPNWAFGPVWTILYALMAYAFWRVLTSPPTARRAFAICMFAAQILLSAMWSVIFFGLENPASGLVVIIALLGFVAATIYAFIEIDTLATLLLAPYIIWVAFTSLLNIGIVILNQGSAA